MLWGDVWPRQLSSHTDLGLGLHGTRPAPCVDTPAFKKLNQVQPTVSDTSK